MIRILIADDEAPARARLARLLSAIPDVKIIGEAASGPEVLAKVVDLKPELVLLDIQMPGASGIDVIVSLPKPRPKIVFCTAFDRYAVAAFELHAVDYLLKPVNRVRLAQAIERIRQNPTCDAETELDRVADAAREKCSRLLAKCGDRFRVIPQREVVYFSSEDGLTMLHTRDRHYFLEPTLNELEERLDPNVFFRISRSATVNLDFVTEVRPMPGALVDVLMSTGVTLPVSRRRVKDLLSALQGSGASSRS